MKAGWKVGLTLYIYINKRYRKGILTTSKDSKWRFKPENYRKTVCVCPFKNKWHYNIDAIKWRAKIKVLFIGHKPFKLCREKVGQWRGAKTGRTKPVLVQVWQIPNSSTVLVGHLGAYTLATVCEGTLKTLIREPCVNEQYYIGRGKLSGPTFKTLKIVGRNIPKRMSKGTTAAIYKIPSRDELGV